MRDAGVGWEEIRIEDTPGVGACEVPGFGYRVEDLSQGGAVDGEVVDGFMLEGGLVGDVVREGEHGLDGASVGGCEAFALLRKRGPVNNACALAWLGKRRWDLWGGGRRKEEASIREL